MIVPVKEVYLDRKTDTEGEREKERGMHKYIINKIKTPLGSGYFVRTNVLT